MQQESDWVVRNDCRIYDFTYSLIEKEKETGEIAAGVF